MKWLRVLPFVLLVLLSVTGALADDPADETTDPATDTPTVEALAGAVIPPRDRVDLAVRLLGLTEIPQPPASPPDLRVGDRATFSATNTFDRQRITIDATLGALGEHVALWVEDGSNVRSSDLQALAESFDTEIYPNARALWGSESIPGVDGDPRVHGLFARNLGATTAAYFASDHTLPRAVYPPSNQREMFFFNLDIMSGGLVLPVVESVVAHEFQHMIRQNLQPNEDTWLNEGMSQFTQFFLYNDLDGSPIYFLAEPNTQLTDWHTDPTRRSANYGAATLFLIYFYDRFGIEAVQALSAHPAARAWESVDDVARAYGAESADTLFADWVMANLLSERRIEALPDGVPVPGYESLPPLITPLPKHEILDESFSAKSALPPYATDYYLMPSPSGGARLTITLEAPAEAALLPTLPAGHILYSNRADLSDSRATRRFDLTGVDSADLDYRIWYDLEADWDYGYVMASRDGETWEVLTTSHMATRDPNEVAYGPAYTGESRGWLNENIPLDAYAGAPVWLRFEMITDDAVNRPGMAVDDVRVAALAYAEDFETGTSIGAEGWLTEGWLRTDNRLPARFVVQTAAITPDGALITRGEARGVGEWTVELPPDANRVWIAISPLAPVTTTPIDYRLTVEAGSRGEVREPPLHAGEPRLPGASRCALLHDHRDGFSAAVDRLATRAGIRHPQRIAGRKLDRRPRRRRDGPEAHRGHQVPADLIARLDAWLT
ncbi:MAG: immune inhibitor A [Chloroflexi bacterium]|nr:immune inhibitor A [Chloroflexota bacterium]